MTREKRSCGDCQECCVVMSVDALRKPIDVACEHQCATGCGIYTTRPNACRSFTCAWLEGVVPKNLKPNRTHMVIWPSAMQGARDGGAFNVLQCNVRAGKEVDRQTFVWLKMVSTTMPVLVVKATRTHLIHYKTTIGSWDNNNFVKLRWHGDRIVGLKEVERASVLADEETRAAYAQKNLDAIAIKETEPTYRANQIAHAKEESER